uniref:FAD/NAD(P)-binding domain-containing protein n=1 Tax=Alexandrium monilatum TaxID=311494 RepID=A0A7S4Q910_9DINO
MPGGLLFTTIPSTMRMGTARLCKPARRSAGLDFLGNLIAYKIDQYPGEDSFGGYIEYASLNRADFSQVADKVTTIVGHGAFAIENVRTCLEFDCAKMVVLCRRRNITAPKPVSWLVTQHPVPIPGPVMMEALCDAYKLLEWDPWTAYSVTTDAKRSKCRIDQGTMFGVTDVYFAAGYYGLMDIVIGDVKKLSFQCIQLKNGKKIQCEVILKTVGVRGDYQTDKILGLKELVGYWVNGDQLFPAITNSLFVQASNFAGFSIGPGLAGSVEQILWFVDFPMDFEMIRGTLPRHNKENNVIKGNALYVYSAAHAASTAIMAGQVPGLGLAAGVMGTLKHVKQRIAHPVEPFIRECTAEWEMYCDMCLANPNCKDKPRPPYPYTVESLERYKRMTDVAMGIAK